MKRVTVQIAGKVLELPFPETEEEIRELVPDERSRVELLRHGLHHRMRTAVASKKRSQEEAQDYIDKYRYHAQTEAARTKKIGKRERPTADRNWEMLKLKRHGAKIKDLAVEYDLSYERARQVLALTQRRLENMRPYWRGFREAELDLGNFQHPNPFMRGTEDYTEWENGHCDYLSALHEQEIED